MYSQTLNVKIFIPKYRCNADEMLMLILVRFQKPTITGGFLNTHTHIHNLDANRYNTKNIFAYILPPYKDIHIYIYISIYGDTYSRFLRNPLSMLKHTQTHTENNRYTQPPDKNPLYGGTDHPIDLIYRAQNPLPPPLHEHRST